MKIKFGETVGQGLIRNYYFNEALAFYERYYLPLIASSRKAQENLQDPGRHEDRPPTWVPLVFHCTTEERLQKILKDGLLKRGVDGTVSFTELPIGELDRMRYRFPSHRGHHVAIGFPRRYIQSLGLTPVLYLRHNSAARDAVERLRTADPVTVAAITKFVEPDDDVAVFQEVRTTVDVDIARAVWILTTNRVTEENQTRLVIPGIETFIAKFGRIPRSYWHRSHQLGILGEWQFIALDWGEDCLLRDFSIIGEHYWRQQVILQSEMNVTLPIGRKPILFDSADFDRHRRFSGPFHFIDLAKFCARLLLDAENNIDEILPSRLLADIAQEALNAPIAYPVQT